MRALSLVAAFALFIAPAPARPAPSYDLRAGDVVFQATANGQSRAVAAATGSPFTMVLEAVGPVRFTSVEDFIRSSAKGTFRIKRLVDSRLLTPAALAKAAAYGEAQLGRAYSFQFRWDDQTLYCSELVWKWYAAAGIRLVEPQAMRNYHLQDPAVRALITARYGSPDNLPLDEPVVAPAGRANSPQLRAVAPR